MVAHTMTIIVAMLTIIGPYYEDSFHHDYTMTKNDPPYMNMGVNLG